MCTCSAARLGLVVESCVRVCGQDNITVTKHNDIVRVGGTIIKELIDSICHRLSGGRLLGTNGAERGRGWCPQLGPIAAWPHR